LNFYILLACIKQ